MKMVLLQTLGIALLTLATDNCRAQETRSGSEDPLIGPVTIEQLFDLEGWFGADFVGYTPNRSYTALLKDYLEDITIECYLGTWCEDSEIQVPRMLKVLQQGNVDPSHFEMYGLDREMDSPANEEDQWGITKVPTFVLVHKGGEIGRIEEEPVGTLEKDLVGLIMKAFPEKYPFYEENKQADVPDDLPATDSDGSTGDMPPKDRQLDEAPPK